MNDYLIYERVTVNGVPMISKLNDTFSLAGYNLIYKAWERRGKPLNKGWHVTADDLIQIHTNEQHNSQKMMLVIDFKPKSKNEIGLVQILDVYAYTYSDDAKVNPKPKWTPLMLRLKEVLDVGYDPQKQQKQNIIALLP